MTWKSAIAWETDMQILIGSGSRSKLQGSNFKLSPCWLYLKTCLNCTNCEIFIPNKKTDYSSMAYFHILLEIYPLSQGYNLDHKLPLDYGHVGHDGFMKKLLNVTESMQ